MQSKTQSAVEVIASTALAFAVSLFAASIIYPLYGMPVTISTNLQVTLWFTVISIVRSYLSRRFFNWINHKSN